MKAAVAKIKGSKNKHEMKTPNLNLECWVIFEDDGGIKYYLPEDTEYILKLEGRRSPASGWFDYNVHTGLTCDIEFENFSGDRIITVLRPYKA